MRIRSKLMLTAVLGVLVAVSAVSFAAYRIARDGLREQIGAGLESIAQSRAAHVRTFLREHKRMVGLAATARVLRAGLRSLQASDADRATAVQGLNARLRDFLDLHECLYEVFILDHQGRVVASTDSGNIGLDRSTDAYFVGAQDGPFVKDVYHSKTTGRPSLALSAPLADRASGELLGVLVARLSLDGLNEIVTDRTGMGTTGETYLINRYGFMITPSRFRKDSFLRQKVDTGNAGQHLAHATAMRAGRLAEGLEHKTSVYSGYRGVRVLGVHDHIPEMGWGLVAEMDTREAFAPIARLRTAIVLFAGLSSAVALAAAYFLARRISRPIHELHVGSVRIGNGDLGHRVHISTGDEIEQLADEFNRMAEKLSASRALLEGKVAERTAHLEREIAERKRAENRLKHYAAELEQANEELKQFTYIVSHDLRAPLVNLKGFAAELRSALAAIDCLTDAAGPHLDEERGQATTTAAQEDIAEALGFIESSVSRMDSFINALLELSRAGHRELNLEQVDMRALAEATLGALAHQIEERHVSVSVGPLPQVVADRTSMEQILGNLLSNAVMYLDPSRPGEIEISAVQGSSETTFRVRDNGRGIAATDLDKVFAPFRRAGSQEVPGEGMGLAYVQAMVRRHGGRIWCESEPGVGTTFTFTIANHIEKGGERARTARRDHSPGRRRSGPRASDREEPAPRGYR